MRKSQQKRFAGRGARISLRLDTWSQRLVFRDYHSGVELRANLKSRSYLIEVAFVRELTKETIFLPMGCLKGDDEEIPAEALRGEGGANLSSPRYLVAAFLSHTMYQFNSLS